MRLYQSPPTSSLHGLSEVLYSLLLIGVTVRLARSTAEGSTSGTQNMRPTG